MADDQAEFVLAKLQVVGPVVSRRMFGGVGFYLDGVFFALLLHDRLYFKTDDANFQERYDFFYRELAPDLELYRVRIGDVLTIKAFTKSGSALMFSPIDWYRSARLLRQAA